MVRCKDCGFLALRVNRRGPNVNLEHGELVEARQEYRTNPHISVANYIDNEPVCFMRAKDLFKERGDYREGFNTGHPVPNASDDDGRDIAFSEYLYKWQIYVDRKCDAFTTWWQGFSPKEHREMIDRQRLLEFQTRREDDWAKREEDWQKFQLQMASDASKRADDDKRWREEQAAEERRWRETQEVEAEKRHQREMDALRGMHKAQLWIMGGAVTLAIFIATLLGGAIQANWFPKWFGIGQHTGAPSPPTPDTPSVQHPAVSEAQP